MQRCSRQNLPVCRRCRRGNTADHRSDVSVCLCHALQSCISPVTNPFRFFCQLLILPDVSESWSCSRNICLSFSCHKKKMYSQRKSGSEERELKNEKNGYFLKKESKRIFEMLHLSGSIIVACEFLQLWLHFYFFFIYLSCEFWM